MTEPLLHRIHDQHLWLSQARCFYWEESKALVLSDLHFGKTGHFRKEGINVPQELFKEDLIRLIDQVQFFKPDRLLIVGDLFHSTANKELDLFLRRREDISQVEIHLIEGNHDILSDEWYVKAGIQVHSHQLEVGPFTFVHDENDTNGNDQTYYIHGHRHPAILLQGMGKQYLRFPCFHFTTTHAILPAFSKFSGLSLIEPLKGDAVYFVVEDKLISYHP